MPKTKAAPITFEPLNKKPRTRSAARSEKKKMTTFRVEYSDPEDEHAEVPQVVDSVISKLSKERGDIEIHYDIPGYSRIITHNNVIVHSVMARYNARAHWWILQCNQYQNPLKSLKSGKRSRKEVERPKLFNTLVTTITNDNKLKIMRKAQNKFTSQFTICLDTDEEAARKYECVMSNIFSLACEVLDEGDEYIMETYR
ncbi:hypothetical protein H4219_006291 [Mycoemilia scoparia]|uniref:Uncharacterized protein n=1 Tax=Mycoemilia scoparia TaxID=417184 RepID=A0A9W7ZPH4_9FUNG|nr:hypothetical protein H4219_006291 [Mycoemilia scoparia]